MAIDIHETIENLFRKHIRRHGGQLPDTLYIGNEEELEILEDPNFHPQSGNFVLNKKYRNMDVFFVDQKNHLFLALRNPVPVLYKNVVSLSSVRPRKSNVKC